MSKKERQILIVQLEVDKKYTPLEISHIVRQAMEEHGIDPYKAKVMTEENYVKEQTGYDHVEGGQGEPAGEFNTVFQGMLDSLEPPPKP